MPNDRFIADDEFYSFKLIADDGQLVSLLVWVEQNVRVDTAEPTRAMQMVKCGLVGRG